MFCKLINFHKYYIPLTYYMHGCDHACLLNRLIAFSGNDKLFLSTEKQNKLPHAFVSHMVILTFVSLLVLDT